MSAAPRPNNKFVPDDRLKRVTGPFFDRARGNDVGMASETQHRAAGAAPRPEIVDISETQVLAFESSRRQPLREQLLAAVILRRYRTPFHKFDGQGEGRVRGGDWVCHEL